MSRSAGCGLAVADPVMVPCGSCRQVWTDDPSGFCDDCQVGVPSSRPGSLTEGQRDAIVGQLMSRDLLLPRQVRAETIAKAVPGWKWGGDLGGLSQLEAGDLLEYLEGLK
jgi:hypothetical protein